MINFFKGLYLNNITFILLIGTAVIFTLGFFIPVLLLVGKISLLLLLLFLFTDMLMLFRLRDGITGQRSCSERFSNGDNNEIHATFHNHYPFDLKAIVIDELPVQFQIRDFKIDTFLPKGESVSLKYDLKPVKRGEYLFGSLNLFICGPINLISRRFSFSSKMMVKVYPSYVQMRKYELHAIAARHEDLGIKKLRKVGHNMEFDQLRDYVPGDDIRTINWKATARSGQLIVNQYQEEKAQPVYCVIDKGRAMKMPFNGMTLLDYAINSTLVISNIALKKEDKAGLMIYNDKLSTYLPAEKRPDQLKKIISLLYNEKTAYLESDHEIMFSNIWQKLNHRSLLFMFTNFESFASLRRQLPYLKKLAKRHLLVVIFFENTELEKLLINDAQSLEDIYEKTIAEKFSFEKRMIVKELELHGIPSILTAPEHLSVNLINKYLEIKARNIL